jgi:hypothetical protein
MSDTDEIIERTAMAIALAYEYGWPPDNEAQQELRVRHWNENSTGRFPEKTLVIDERVIILGKDRWRIIARAALEAMIHERQ